MCESGSTTRIVSAPRLASGIQCRFWITLKTRLLWESITPLGRSAVPEVYCSRARSDAFVATGANAPDASRSSRWNDSSAMGPSSEPDFNAEDAEDAEADAEDAEAEMAGEVVIRVPCDSPVRAVLPSL